MFEEAKQQYDELGYAVLPNVIPESQLQILREECAYFVGYIDGSMKARGRESYGITHRGKRYFIAKRYHDSRRMADFLFSEIMADVTRAFVGDEVCLFNEQWVVKGPEQGMKFAWHQDSGYVRFRDPENEHSPYLTCWCALDDMTEENGTIYVLPHDVCDTRNQILPHRVEAGSNDLVAYDGDHPGEPIEISAGSIAVFTSTTLHRSSTNHSSAARRAYLAQYAAAPIYHSDGSAWSEITPFISAGKVIYDPVADGFS